MPQRFSFALHKRKAEAAPTLLALLDQFNLEVSKISASASMMFKCQDEATGLVLAMLKAASPLKGFFSSAEAFQI